MEDLEALGHIAYATGFFGESARHFFPDAALFTDLWVRPYLSAVGCGNFLALLGGAPVGYILGTAHLRAYRRHLLGNVPWLLGWALQGRYSHLRPSLAYLLRMVRYPTPHAPTGLYPAQLHVNLLPQARGVGLGQALLSAHLEALRKRGVRGVQLSTTWENRAAMRLYERTGFRAYCEAKSPLWQPWLGREVVHVVMVKEIL